MKYRYIFLANLIGWAGISLLDMASEKGHDGLPMNVYIFAAGFIVAAIYILIDLIRVKECPASFRRILILTGEWIGTGLALGVPITVLVGNNKWIIPQAQGGWEHFLNGIEYGLFGIFFIAEPVLIFWAYNGIMALSRHIKNKKNTGGI